jgi:hypothetical protein
MAYDRLRSLPSGIFGNVRCDSGDLDPTTLQYAEVTVTNAQIKALRATAVTLVPAPGAGKLLEFVALALLLDYGSNALTNGGNIKLKYASASGDAVTGNIAAAGLMTATEDSFAIYRPSGDIGLTKANCENQPFVLHNVGAAEFDGNAGADTVLRCKIAYRVHTTGW